MKHNEHSKPDEAQTKTTKKNESKSFKLQIEQTWLAQVWQIQRIGRALPRVAKQIDNSCKCVVLYAYICATGNHEANISQIISY